MARAATDASAPIGIATRIGSDCARVGGMNRFLLSSANSSIGWFQSSAVQRQRWQHLWRLVRDCGSDTSRTGMRPALQPRMNDHLAATDNLRQSPPSCSAAGVPKI